MNQITYTLSENNVIVMETQAASVDSAVDYFVEMKPDFFSDFQKYSIGLKSLKKN
jgi:hypothetical protein